MSTTPDTTRHDGSAWYEIRLQGRLDARWSNRFDGMTLTVVDGCTVLTGAVVDQAALHGLLQQLRDVGLSLVSVHQVGTRAGPPSPPLTGTTSGD